MKSYTTNTLIEAVKRRASIPENQQTFLEEDFIAFANEEMDLGMIPHVLSYHEDYFIYTQLVPLVSSQIRYEIPSRAVGNKLVDLAYQDSGGNIFEMTRIKIDALPTYQEAGLQTSFSVYYVEGTDIVMLPLSSPMPNGFLRFSYYLRPNEIVSEDRVAIITGINRTSGEISVANVPGNINVGDTLDLIQTKNPHKTLALDVNCLSINTTTKTFTFNVDDIPASLANGDQIALAGETIVPQVPSDLHSMLSQRIAARCLESIGDVQGLTTANTKLGEMEAKTGLLISNRVEGAPIKVINRAGLLRNRRIFWR